MAIPNIYRLYSRWLFSPIFCMAVSACEIYATLFLPSHPIDFCNCYYILQHHSLLCIINMYINLLHRGDAVYGYILLQYISPTTVATAMLLIIATSKLHISSKLINRLAASSFAVYLVCVNPNLLTPYRNLFSDLYHTYSDLMYWLIVLGLVAIIYIAIAVIDTIRIFLWKRIELTV